MARISKGKFRNLRATYTAQKYFTITASNIGAMRRLFGDNIRIGEQYIMRTMPMSDELIAAMDSKIGVSKSTLETIDRLTEKNPALGALLSRPRRWDDAKETGR